MRLSIKGWLTTSTSSATITRGGKNTQSNHKALKALEVHAIIIQNGWFQNDVQYIT